MKITGAFKTITKTYIIEHNGEEIRYVRCLSKLDDVVDSYLEELPKNMSDSEYNEILSKVEKFIDDLPDNQTI